MDICIYGASSDEIDESYKEAAFSVGKMLAVHDCGMVFGAGMTGLMGAAYRGFTSVSHKGELIAVSPKFFNREGVLIEDDSRIIWTDTMRERKQIMEEHADAFIVLPGGIGTMDEFFEIFTLKQLGRHDKPVVLLNHDGYYDDIKAFLRNAVEKGFMMDRHANLCCFADNAEEAWKCLKK